MPAFLPASSPIAAVALSLFGVTNATKRATLLWVLAIATEKQLPLVNALDALADESAGNWQHKLEDFTAMVQEGTPMAEAAAAVPGLLADETLMAIRVAAESGTLVTALRSEAERISTQNEFSNSRNLLQTTIYVASVVTVSMLVVSFIMVYIIPKFKKIFEDFGVELPRMTMWLIDVSDAAVSLWFLAMPLYFLTLGGVVYYCYWATNVGSGTSALASILPRTSAGSLLRCLSHVVDAGRPLAPAIESMANHHSSRAVYRKLSAVFDDVESGDNCWESMELHGLLKRRELAVIRSAERAGNAGWALRHVGHELDRRFSNRLELIGQLVRPVILLLLGIAVGFVVIALFMPVLKLINDLS